MANPAIANPIAIVLAAGASTRMGRCKATLPWHDGQTLLTYQCRQWRLVGVTPLVVLGPHNAHLPKAEADPIQVVINPQPGRGKTSSILAGLQALPPDVGAIAIAAVDQPRPAWVYQRLLESYGRSPTGITLPIYQGRLGHPVIFAPPLLPQLLAIREETLGLRQVLQTCSDQLQPVDCGSPTVLCDINTPAAYSNYRDC